MSKFESLFVKIMVVVWCLKGKKVLLKLENENKRLIFLDTSFYYTHSAGTDTESKNK